MARHQQPFQVRVPFLEALQELGIEPEKVFARQKALRNSIGSKVEAKGMDFVLMLDAAAELSSDPGFAIRLGQTINICKSGSFGFALMSCATFRDTLQLMLGYQKVLAPGPYWEAVPQQDGIIVRMDLKRGTAEQHRLVTELALSMNIHHGRFLSGNAMQGLEIEVNYPEPSHSGTSLGSLSLPVAYDREYSQLWLPDHVLSMPVKTADPAVNVLYLQQCEEILHTLGEAESTTAEVRRLLVESSDGFPDVSSVAKQLSLSERTLRRRLKDESTSYRAVVDDVKNALARRYLAGTELEIIEIAHLLDYSEPENFYRAFARWNGVTPAEFRRGPG